MRTILLALLSLTAFADQVDFVSGGGINPAAATANQCIISNASLQWVAGACSAGSGDFVGPGSSTDNAVLRFDSTTGKLGQNSGVIIDDSNNMSGVGTFSSGVITQSGTTLAATYAALSGGIFTGSTRVTAAGGPMFRSIDGGTEGVNADPHNTFEDSDSVMGRVGFITSNSNDMIVQNATAAGSLILATNGTTAVTVNSSQVANFANAPTAAAVAIPTISSSSTLTNKTIDSDDNSISDLNIGDVKAGDNLLKKDLCFQARTGANETVYLVLDAYEPITVASVTTDLTSGSITMAVKDDGVDITSCNAISITTTETETDCTDTAISADQDLSLVFTSNSTAVDLRVCVHAIKN